MQDTHHTIATHENVKFCVMSSLELLQDVIPIKSLICIVCSGGLDADGPWLFHRSVRLFLLFHSYVHEAGGLCILDEVQTGFGRAGDYFWIFESQGMQCVYDLRQTG